MEQKFGEAEANVILNCNKEYHPVSDVEFLDIEENMFGQDVISFKCPVCGATEKSLILG